MALAVRIAAGELDIHTSGCFILAGDQVVDFFLGADDNPYRVELVFNKTEERSAGVIGQQVAIGYFRITLNNFNQSVASSSTEPVYIANHEGRKLLLHVAVLNIGQGTTSALRTLFYTFYAGETVDG